MGSPVKRKDILLQRRREILAAAADLFSRGGYHGVTMDAIAQRARVSKGNLYWYFGSKQEMFQLLFEDIVQTLVGPLVDIMESEWSPRQKLRALASACLDAAEANPEAVRLLWRIAIQPELGELLSAQYSKRIGPFIDYLKPIFTALGDDDPDATAMLYAVSLDALMALAVIGGDIYDRAKLMSVIEKVFMNFGEEKDDQSCLGSSG